MNICILHNNYIFFILIWHFFLSNTYFVLLEADVPSIISKWHLKFVKKNCYPMTLDFRNPVCRAAIIKILVSSLIKHSKVAHTLYRSLSFTCFYLIFLQQCL